MEEIENFVFHSYCCQEERHIKALEKNGWLNKKHGFPAPFYSFIGCIYITNYNHFSVVSARPTSNYIAEEL